jgi:hypothetical protein
MRETKWVSIIVVMTAGIVASMFLHPMYVAEATTKLIDTSTGERRPLMNTVEPLDFRKAPLSISGDNVYVAWPTNDSVNQNEDVMFRASNDGGQTFGDKINLSNTTDANSTRVEIDSDADGVVVTWWETNQTDDTPVMRVSSDNGVTFGPLLRLATNGTIGEAAGE